MAQRIDPAFHDQHLKIVEEYQAGAGSVVLSRKYGYHAVTIRQIVRSFGVVTRTKQEGLTLRRKYDDAQEARMAELYREGKSLPELATLFGTNTTQIHNALNRRSVACRHRTSAKAVDESAFDHAEESEAAAYFVGLLMADGYVSDKNQVSLQLSGPDAGHVREFRAFLKSSHKLYEGSYAHSRWAPFLRLCVQSKRLADALARYGLTPRKSLTAKVIGLENNRHFWRGVVCGDGSLAIVPQTGRPYISLCGSRSMVEQFRDYATTLTVSTATPHAHRRSKNCWDYRIAGAPSVPVVRNLFEDCTVALSRKHDMARRILGEL